MATWWQPGHKIVSFKDWSIVNTICSPFLLTYIAFRRSKHSFWNHWKIIRFIQAEARVRYMPQHFESPKELGIDADISTHAYSYICILQYLPRRIDIICMMMQVTHVYSSSRMMNQCLILDVFTRSLFITSMNLRNGIVG